MSADRYPVEVLDGNYDDDGTMPDNVAELAGHVIGRKIVSVERGASAPGKWGGTTTGTALVLDSGKRVVLVDTDDCCAYTDLEEIILNLDKIDHAILGVGTTEGYTKWHIYADLGDVVEMQVGWSCGNPFYYGYGYGFDIAVVDPGAS